MAAAFDHANGTISTSLSASSITWAHTCGATADLVVFAGAYSGASVGSPVGIESVTYGGIPLTSLPNNQFPLTVDGAALGMYTLLSAPAGTANVVVTFSRPPDNGGGSLLTAYLEGVSASAINAGGIGLNGVSTGGIGANDLTVQLIGVSVGSLVIFGVNSLISITPPFTAPAPVSNGTSRFSQTTTDAFIEDLYYMGASTSSSTGSVNATYTASGVSNINGVVGAVEFFAGGAPPPVGGAVLGGEFRIFPPYAVKIL